MSNTMAQLVQHSTTHVKINKINTLHLNEALSNLLIPVHHYNIFVNLWRFLKYFVVRLFILYMRNYQASDWPESPAWSVVLAEVLADCVLAYKGGGILVVIRGIVLQELCFIGLVVDTMVDVVADVGDDVGLLSRDPVLLMVFLLWREDNLLCWLFLFHKGVQMTLGLAMSGVILGDGGDDGLPATPLVTSLS